MDVETENRDSEIKTTDFNEKNKFRRKNKRNKFLSNAKGFGKRGIYGRGTHIADDQYTYFINILDAMKLGFESVDEKVAMANNVFDQTVGVEVHLASNQIVSKALESLIGYTDCEHFENFTKGFTENLRPICSDSYASHVLQKLIEISFLRAVGNQKDLLKSDEVDGETIGKKPKLDLLTDKDYNTNEEFDENHRIECSKFVLKVGKFLLNNLEDFVWDRYANHIMRTSILSLSGIHASKIAFDQNKDFTKNTTTYTVPKEWSDVATEFAKRLEMWPQFSELPYADLTSAFLSSICLGLKQTDKNLLKHFGKKILVEAFLKADDTEEMEKIEIKDDDDEDHSKNEGNNLESAQPILNLSKVFQNGCSIRLLETLLIIAGPKLFTQLYAMLFPEKIAVLALDRSTNFAVQKVLENVKEKIDFESMFTELQDQFEELLKIGHTGVVAALASACLRLQTKQGAFVIAMQAALHTTGSKEKAETIFKCLVKLKPFEIIADDKSQFVHLHGSLIIQSILKFNKPIFLVNSILGQPAHELISIFLTPNGSYIADVFLESKFIGEKSREKLIRYLEGNYVDIAINKFGSRVIEKLFEVANDGQKTKIVKELADKVNQLNGTPFGRLMYKKFRIETYKLSPVEWKAAFNRANKAEKLFKDIIKD